MGSISVDEHDGDVSSEASTIHYNLCSLDRHVINLCTVVSRSLINRYKCIAFRRALRGLTPKTINSVIVNVVITRRATMTTFYRAVHIFARNKK